MEYRGRLAPSPTGFLHPGHLSTFLVAHRRCRSQSGTLLYRMEDLDRRRCRPQYDQACVEDLARFLDWDDGPDGLRQTDRMKRGIYHDAWRRLRDRDVIYPCRFSRKEIESVRAAESRSLSTANSPESSLGSESVAAGAIREAGDFGENFREPIFPVSLRVPCQESRSFAMPTCSFRFRVPDGEVIEFEDGCAGRSRFVAGEDFGDFAVWSADGYPSYELAVVVDDADMAITEVVRGQDLLLSTARQILLYRALGHSMPQFFHVPLLRTESGQRLSKRNGSTTLRALLQSGWSIDALKLAVANPDHPDPGLVHELSVQGN